MLFPYVFSPQTMDKMQEFIEYIFMHVWCAAAPDRPFQLSLFRGNAELYTIMEDIWQQIDIRKQSNAFWEQVEDIYTAFTTLSPSEIQQIEQWFNGNNDIEGACSNQANVQIVKYAQLKAFNLPIGELLEKFFKGLYDDPVLDRKAVRETITTINDHYRKFVEINDGDICPFCGLEGLDGQYEETREAYDHYLPKSLYPFNSINFHNLVPTCSKCNSRAKKNKDPLHSKAGTRRKAFYPFMSGHTLPAVSIDLDCKDYTAIQKQDLSLCFSHGSNEETETWKELYNIEERYKAHCCSKRGGKDWIVELYTWLQKGESPEGYLSVLAKQTRQKPFAGVRFLKLPFLQACCNAHVFDAAVPDDSAGQACSDLGR